MSDIFILMQTTLNQRAMYLVTQDKINPLAPSYPYMCRSAQLTCRSWILNHYSTNIRTEYFKRAA
jgi:hypothetical protein